jgi:secretion/DNA translocation related TadE-like protein
VSERDERGAAVVVALGLVAALVFVAAVSAGTVCIMVAHRRAQVAADLAALAAAQALQGGGDPCQAAALIAGRHAVDLTRCVIDGTAVVVAVAALLPTALGGRHVPARARAGPQLLPGDPGQQ